MNSSTQAGSIFFPKTLSKTKLIEEYVKLHQLATAQEIKIKKLEENKRSKSDDDDDESGIELEIKS